MKRFGLLIVSGAFVLSACTPVLDTMTRTEAINMCQEKARGATQPTGQATVGVNTITGPSFGLSLNFSDAYIRGLDPAVVYEECMTELAANGQIVEG